MTALSRCVHIRPSCGNRAVRTLSARLFSTENADNTAKDAQDLKTQEMPLKKIEEEMATLKDLYLRNLAEMENLRQRTARELEKEKEYGIKKFAKEILIVNDFLELSLKHDNASREQVGVSLTF